VEHFTKKKKSLKKTKNNKKILLQNFFEGVNFSNFTNKRWKDRKKKQKGHESIDHAKALGQTLGCFQKAISSTHKKKRPGKVK